MLSNVITWVFISKKQADGSKINRQFHWQNKGLKSLKFIQQL